MLRNALLISLPLPPASLAPLPVCQPLDFAGQSPHVLGQLPQALFGTPLRFRQLLQPGFSTLLRFRQGLHRSL